MPLPRLIQDVVDFCYPGICPVCKDAADPRNVLCPVCLGRLANLEAAAACWQCAMPLAEHGAPCPFCQGKGVRNYEHILRLGTFDGPLKDLIHALKYQRRWIAGEFLADRLLARPHVRDLVEGADVLVPVPLHPLRRWGRGYNQAAVVARRLAKACGKPLARPLARTRNTQTQTHLPSRQKRLENLKDAFRLRDAASVTGKRVLVIDDVMTTGATLQSVARALKNANPASLNAVLLAVADPKGRGFEVL